ncbi:MAG: GtrA family protein [Lactobacillus sp.]|jgi:putative flippase GtrA|nr:GtrA family protein [Lactobacillus sp.]MCH3906641.1 GtrA family protein [Lactobacillus sp.]MCH3989723.1 GtrA family protein [Lactobacillus sp.]MCH4068111.1 GtrA family protein [Lactobacillus sp.]MCI1304292.1 GtrA family protein [Lactobacillus sp.]
MGKTKRREQAADREQLRALGKKLVARHRSFYSYVVGGFLAALVNTAAFIILHDWMHSAIIIDNTVAFIISNVFSFFVNKKFVFTENLDKRHGLIYQLGLFMLYRLLSLIPDNLIMVVGMSWLHWPSIIVKIIDQCLVGIFNYLTTKSVFQKHNHPHRIDSKRRKK